MAIEITTKLDFTKRQKAVLGSNLAEKSHNAIVIIEKCILANIATGTGSSLLYISIDNDHMFLSNPNQNLLVREYIASVYNNAGWSATWSYADTGRFAWNFKLR